MEKYKIKIFKDKNKVRSYIFIPKGEIVYFPVRNGIKYLHSNKKYNISVPIRLLPWYINHARLPKNSSKLEMEILTPQSFRISVDDEIDINGETLVSIKTSPVVSIEVKQVKKKILRQENES